jgi:hypothetical protein
MISRLVRSLIDWLEATTFRGEALFREMLRSGMTGSILMAAVSATLGFTVALMVRIAVGFRRFRSILLFSPVDRHYLTPKESRKQFERKSQEKGGKVKTDSMRFCFQMSCLLGFMIHQLFVVE